MTCVNGWFPSLNRRGEVCSGAGEVCVLGVSFGTGTKPKWIDDDLVVYNGYGSEIISARRCPRSPPYW